MPHIVVIFLDAVVYTFHLYFETFMSVTDPGLLRKIRGIKMDARNLY